MIVESKYFLIPLNIPHKFGNCYLLSGPGSHSCRLYALYSICTSNIQLSALLIAHFHSNISVHRNSNSLGCDCEFVQSTAVEGFEKNVISRRIHFGEYWSEGKRKESKIIEKHTENGKIAISTTNKQTER